jgi:hypothetical protein
VRLPNAPGAVTITHSVSQDIQQFNSVACNNGFAHTDNSYLRVFTLSDFGIDTDFAVTNVEIGIEQATGAGGDQPATVNLYTLEGPLLWANLTLIGSAPVSVDDQALTIINMPVEGVATGGSTLVVEFFTPDGNAEGNLLFVGSNNLGQTGLTYLAAADCGVPEPTDTGTLGFPDMHLVMNVTGEAGSADVLWMSEEPVTGTIDADSTADIAMTFDSMTYTVGTQLKALLKVKSDDPVNGTINIPVTMTVAAPAFGVDVGPDQALSERPAKTVTYQVTVMNTSNGPEDTFDIEAVSGNGWTTTAPATVGPLGPGESETIDVVVAIPSDAVPGDTDAAVLTATSQGDSGVSDSATLTTTVTGEYGVVITPPEAAATGLPGEMVTYTLSVMNTGDVTATFGITYTGNTWAVQLSDTSLEIGAGESVELLVSVSIPVAAENGDSDGVTVSANGIGGATDSSVLTTTVLIPTRFVYLPLVMDGYNAP